MAWKHATCNNRALQIPPRGHLVGNNFRLAQPAEPTTLDDRHFDTLGENSDMIINDENM